MQTSTVFVGNLPWQTTEEELQEFMANAGPVVSCAVQRHEDTGRSKGWALVTYASPDIANFAITHFSGREFSGRPLNVRIDRSEVEKLGGVTVFVGNLPWSCSNGDLTTIFSAFQPLHAEVKTLQSGRSRGFGIVRFADENSANAAIQQMNGYQIEGRSIEVREDRPRDPNAPKPAPRQNRTATRRPRRNNRDGAGGADDMEQDLSLQKKEIEPSASLFVNNLDFKSTDDDLFQHFQTIGVDPVSAKVQMNERNGRSKGWGLVTYPSVEDATKAVNELNKSELDGRPIAVRFDAGSN